MFSRRGWTIQNRRTINLTAGRGIAIHEGLLKDREADYLLFVDGKAIGAVEAKPEGYTPIGVEEQSEKNGEEPLDIHHPAQNCITYSSLAIKRYAAVLVVLIASERHA